MSDERKNWKDGCDNGDLEGGRQVARMPDPIFKDNRGWLRRLMVKRERSPARPRCQVLAPENSPR